MFFFDFSCNRTSVCISDCDIQIKGKKNKTCFLQAWILFFFFPTFVEGLVETFQVGAVMWKRETIKPPIFLLRVKPARIKTFSERCAKFSIIRLSAIGRELWKVVLMENFKARQCCFCAPCQRSQVIQRSTSCAVSPRSAQTGQMITTSPLFRRKCASETNWSPFGYI